MRHYLQRKRTSACRDQIGVGLIELMVAMVIGLFLIFGAVTVYQQSRTAFRTTEAVARLQEVGRLAMSVIETDIRMASYWGLNNRAEYITNRSTGTALPSRFTNAHKASLDSCGGTNWAIDLDRYISGTDGTYPFTTSNCVVPASSGAHSAGTDTLTIRRATDLPPAALDPDRIYIQTSRIQGTMFVPDTACTVPTNPDCIPAGYSPPASQSRELVVHAYYVSTGSTMRDDVPALRRKSFANVNDSTEAIVDDEIAPGVEDLQILFGIDNGTDFDSDIDDYVEPNAVPNGAAIVSARITLRIRAEDPEQGFKDDRIYPGLTSAINDNYRRIVVSKTIQLRNTRI